MEPSNIPSTKPANDERVKEGHHDDPYDDPYTPPSPAGSGLEGSGSEGRHRVARLFSLAVELGIERELSGG